MKPKNVLILGIVGNHGSGKSSLSKRLMRDIPKRLAKVCTREQSFADALREKISNILPSPLSKEKKHPYERQVLVMVGELWRNKQANYFVEKFISRLYKFQSLISPVVVISDDVYHWNEREICDVVFYIRNTQYKPPKGYVPQSVIQTEAMLAEAENNKYATYYCINEVSDIDAVYPRMLDQAINQLKKLL